MTNIFSFAVKSPEIKIETKRCNKIFENMSKINMCVCKCVYGFSGAEFNTRRADV